MKKLLASAIVLFIVSEGLGQDCKSNLYMTSNARMAITIYDKKAAPVGIQTWQVTDVKKSGDSYTSSVNVSFTDDKGKQISSGTGIYKCTGGMLSADMKMFLPQDQMSKMEGTEAKVEPVYLEYPASPSVGMALKDAEFNMDIAMKNGMSTHITFKEEGRKVEGKENITTPAGTWDAYLISYNGNMKTKIVGIGIPVSFSVKEWYVPGMGIVKSETYAKNGKLSGSSLLTSVTK